MGKRGKELAKERREKRLWEISRLRQIPFLPDQRWWTPETVAVVTGSNRGIGYEIARQLAGHGLRVVATSRDTGRGMEAVEEMRKEGLSNVDFHQLDVTSDASIAAFVEWVRTAYGGLDILVNNAGVNYNVGSNNSMEHAEETIVTNYFGTKKVMKSLIPIMKPSAAGARILNVSSRLGRLNGRRNRICDKPLRDELSHDDLLSEPLIDGMVSRFLDEVRDGSWEHGRWPQVFTDYSVSKLAVNAYTRLVARELRERPQGQRIYVNCCCPGWVRTCMTGWAGNMTAEDGADTAVWAVLMSAAAAGGGRDTESTEAAAADDDGGEGESHGDGFHQPRVLLPTGKFFAERREIGF